MSFSLDVFQEWSRIDLTGIDTYKNWIRVASNASMILFYLIIISAVPKSFMYTLLMCALHEAKMTNV